MDKFERVRAALAGDDVDRVPVSFWYHFPGKVTGREMVEAHLGYYRTYEPDFLKVMNDNGYDHPPGGPLKSVADWRRVEPLPLSSRCFQDQLRPLAEIGRTLKNECMVITTVFGSYATARRLYAPPHLGPLSTLGAYNRLVEHLREDPQAVEHGLQSVAESLARFAVECVAAGADGIFYSAQGSSRDELTDEEFRRFLLPLDRLILQAVAGQGRFHLLHVCGPRIRLEEYLKLVADLGPHASRFAVNWAPQQENLSIRDARAASDVCLIGGVDQQGVIVSGPEKAIREEVVAALAEGGNRKFMLGAGCTVPSNIPSVHLHAAYQAAWQG